MPVSSKHTPGSWRVEEGTTTIWGRCNPDDMSTWGMGIPVAEARIGRTWSGGPIIGCDEAEANARLIAAAPELDEALSTLVQYAEWQITEGRDYHPTLMSAIVKASAALAKARGEG